MVSSLYMFVTEHLVYKYHRYGFENQHARIKSEILLILIFVLFCFFFFGILSGNFDKRIVSLENFHIFKFIIFLILHVI